MGGEDFAVEQSMMYIETSAKTKIGIQQAFEEVVLKILDSPDLLESTVPLGNRAQGGGGGNTGMKLGGGNASGESKSAASQCFGLLRESKSTERNRDVRRCCPCQRVGSLSTDIHLDTVWFSHSGW